MSKKSEFINFIETLIEGKEDEMNEEAKAFWEALKDKKEEEKTTFTDNGKLIMKYLQELPEGTPMMKAKEIAEGMFISSRAVSGSMRKLVSDGYVEKIGADPVMYLITEKGKNINIED